MTPLNLLLLMLSFYNRTEIIKVAKNAVGVYIFKSKIGHCSVGSSISLYNRVCS